MVSIIISSKDQSLLKQITINIEKTIGIEYEILAISNPGLMGICHAYNIGAQRAKYEYLVFCHEDILYHTPNWGSILENHLKNDETALIGILGCSIKTKIPSGVYSGIHELNRINQLQQSNNSIPVHYYANPNMERISEVAVLDGMFLATKKRNWKKYQFDSEQLNGFHGYDIDFSLGQRNNGNVIVVYDILIEHLSSGGNTRDWIDAQLVISKKWKEILPLNYEQENQNALLKSADTENIKIFAISLFQNEYKLKLAKKMALKFMLKKPFSRVNIFFLKKILFNYCEN